MSNRPISPHLQVYRPQLTSVLSISHRATGIFLTLGTFVLTYWLMAVAGGPERYDACRALFSSWPMVILIAGWIFAFYFHLCNGIRHLFWNAGKGFELETLYKSGYAALAAAVLLTIATYIFFAVKAGGAA